eukprot:gene2595-3556_t
MEEEIINLSTEYKNSNSKDTLEKLNKYLEDKPLKEFTQILVNSSKPSQFAEALLIDFQQTNKKIIMKKAKIIKKIVELIQTEKYSKEIIPSFLKVINEQLDFLPEEVIFIIAQHVVNFLVISEGKVTYCLDLIPKLFVLLHTPNSFIYMKDENSKRESKSGYEWKKGLVTELCLSTWDSSKLSQMITTFKESKMSEDDMNIVVEKCIRELNNLELNELPQTIYQLLLLSSRGCESLILKGIVNYFDALEKYYQENDVNFDKQEKLTSCQGTILLHINFAVKQDQKLGKEFMKLLKSQKISLSHFSLAFLLSIANIPSFSDSVHKFIKSAILQSNAELSRPPLYQISKATSNSEIFDEIIEVAKRTNYGWDCILQSVINLGTFFMDQKDSSEEKGTKLSECGMSILLHICGIHDSIKMDILEQIFTRIIIKAENVHHYIELLKRIIDRNRGILMDHKKSFSKFKEIIEYLPLQSPDEASLLLEAIEPLFKTSTELQDYAILILRKSIFNMDLQSREVALNGFLSILKTSKASRVGTSTNSNDSSLDFEILGTIRRCFSQQSEVKKLMYTGLRKVIDHKPQLIDTITGYIISHFFQYYKSSGNPIVLEKCVNSNTTELIEPIPDLIFLLIKLEFQSSEIDKESKNIIELKKILESLSDRICNCNLEDFDLDDSTEYSIATEEGKVNQNLGGLLCGVFQVLMEYVMTNEEKDLTERVSSITNLYTNYSTLNSTILKKSKVKGKSKFDSKSFVPLLSLEFTSSMLEIFQEKEQDISLKFKLFIMDLCESQLNHLKKNINEFKESSELITTFSELSKSLIGQLVEEFDNAEEDKKKKKTYSQHLAKNFNECFHIMNSLGLDYLLQWIELMFDNQNEDANVVLNDMLQSFEAMIVSSIGIEFFSDETKILVDILYSVSILMTDKSLLNSHIKWVTDICQKCKLTHLPLVKSIFKFFGSLVFSFDSISKLQKIISDIKSVCGEIGESSQITQFENEIVTVESHESISESILTSISFMIAELEIDFKKTERMYDQETEQLIHESSQSVNKRFEIQTSIFKKLTEILKIVGMFLKLNLGTIPATSLFDTATKLYQFLSEIVQFIFNVQKETNKKETIPKSFHELISKTKSLLSNSIYDSISQYNTNQGNEEKLKLKRITKESRLFPQLIFNIEQLDQFLIKLSTLTSVNFMKDMKVSSVRIFVLPKSKKKTQEEEEEEENPSKGSMEEEEEEIQQEDEEIEQDPMEEEEEIKKTKKRKNNSPSNQSKKKK